jgi:hypothetical protein
MRNLWFLDNEEKLKVTRVAAGISNGINTEIKFREEMEGRQVILREKI